MKWIAAFGVVTLALAVFLLSVPPKALGERPLSPIAQGPLRITAFGTSLTAPPQTWPDVFAQRLAACRDTPVAVTRVAGPGMGSAWGLEQTQRVIDSAPNVVLIEFAINDADLRDGVRLSKAHAQHLRLIEALKDALPNTQLVLLTMSPAYGLRGWVRPRLNAHYEQYQLLADESGLALIDLNARWRATARKDQGLAKDGIHPSPDIASAIIVPALVEAFSRASGRICP